MKDLNNRPTILVVEDDPEQMEVLVQVIMGQLNKSQKDDGISERALSALSHIQVAKVTNVRSLKKAVSANNNLILAIMDCNMPNQKGEEPNDQLVKENHRITGQHNAVDAVIASQPTVPITMISSLNRFRNLLIRFYKNNHDLSINFISKSDQTMIKRNIAYYIRRYLKSVD